MAERKSMHENDVLSPAKGGTMSKKKTPGVKAKRNYKDSLFCMIFKEKKELLELYNAINGTDYQNPEELEITTLENAIYMTMKNDVSCCINMNLQLYEQQSTVNPNMPIRFLLYFIEQLKLLLLNRDIYSKKRIALPTPKFFVFYNGREEEPECRVVRLSDSFIQREKEYSLELVAYQYNINPGYNEELKRKCPTLMEYMEYVDRVRRYSESMPLTEAVGKAIDECIEEDILREFLQKNRVEVMNMSIYEYDEEKHNRTLYLEGYEEGENAGYVKGENAKKLSIAVRMKTEGMSYELINRLTDITIEEMEAL